MTASTAQSPFGALIGQYKVHPGRRRSIVGQRPVLQAGTLVRLLRGQSGVRIPHSLGCLFSLCGHAHQRVAALAWNAAYPQADPIPVAPRALLRLETARDHLRGMALDWPLRLGLGSRAVQWLMELLSCPAMSATTSKMTDERAIQFLGLLRNLILEIQGTVHYSPLQLVEKWRPLALSLKPELNALDVLHPDPLEQNLRLCEVARAMRLDADFVQSPTWRGQCAETGAWTRLRHRQDSVGEEVSVWTRLSSRWREVVDIAFASQIPEEAQQDPLLSSGALALGEGSAIAWCEMARGLLVHWVQVDERGAVVDYRVLAPTEWNFHPQSTLAYALSELRTDDARSAQCLVAAFDACVECTIDSLATGLDCA